MRSAESWAREINDHDEYRDDICLSLRIRAIQRDALEAAAKVCTETMRDDEPEYNAACRQCRHYIQGLMP